MVRTSYSSGTPVLSSYAMIMRLVGDEQVKEAAV
jgi:hypothetical protein